VFQVSRQVHVEIGYLLTTLIPTILLVMGVPRFGRLVVDLPNLQTDRNNQTQIWGALNQSFSCHLRSFGVSTDRLRISCRPENRNAVPLNLAIASSSIRVVAAVVKERYRQVF